MGYQSQQNRQKILDQESFYTIFHPELSPPLNPSLHADLKVVLLGSTGSIGSSTAEVVRHLSGQIKLVGLSGHKNTERLLELTREFQPDAIAIGSSECTSYFQNKFAKKAPQIFYGEEGLLNLATLPQSDLLIMAITGTAGLRPTMAAIEAGKKIAIASKEILVMAGAHVIEAAKRNHSQLLPLDSEHSAIFQCLQGHPNKEVHRLILTCSGGPFLNSSEEVMNQATPAEALAHPTWKMGKKISIDSATLFNKALEMIEAHFLFDIPMDKIEVVIHPESIIHSMVEFVDGSIIAQLSHHSMTLPIQYALTYPKRLNSPSPRLDLATIGKLHFSSPRNACFPALNLARQAMQAGGSAPAILNAANEKAVELFLSEKISFPAISQLVARGLETFPITPTPSLEELIEIDREVKIKLTELASPK